MSPDQIVLYLGIAIILFGLAVWFFKPPAEKVENTIKFLGLELSLNTPAFVVAGLGIVLVLISTQLRSPAPPGTASQPTPHPFTLGTLPPGIERNPANENIKVGIFYQSGDLQSDAEKVAAALNAAGYKYQASLVDLANVVYSGERTHKAVVLVKSTPEFHDMRPAIRELVLKALQDRKPDDVVLPNVDFSYGANTPDRGVIQVDLF